MFQQFYSLPHYHLHLLLLPSLVFNALRCCHLMRVRELVKAPLIKWGIPLHFTASIPMHQLVITSCIKFWFRILLLSRFLVSEERVWCWRWPSGCLFVITSLPFMFVWFKRVFVFALFSLITLRIVKEIIHCKHITVFITHIPNWSLSSKARILRWISMMLKTEVCLICNNQVTFVDLQFLARYIHLNHNFKLNLKNLE